MVASESRIGNCAEKRYNADWRKFPLPLTLLVENNAKIADIYLLNLAVYTGLDVTVTNSTAAALELIKKSKFDLIISRARIGAQDAAALLTSSLQEQGLDIPVLVIGDGVFPKKGASGPIKGSLNLKSVVKGAAQALGITAQEMARKQVEDFFPLQSRLFEWVTCPRCDVYALDPDGSMVKVFEANATIDKAKLDKSVRLSQGTFYVDKLDRLKMVDHLSAELMARLDDKDLNPDEQIQAAESNLQLLSQKLITLGITEETIALARKGMNSMAANAKKYPKLGPLLKRMLENETGYHFRHTQIVTYIALHIVHNIDWGTAEQEEKITFIAFFHDIALETEEQARIKSKEELRTSKLEPRARELVEKHAQLAAELVHKYPHAPMGADQIIRQHHGVLNGVGFSDHFGANLSPMALVFLVAEEYTRLILAHEKQELDAKFLIRELRDCFSSNRLQKIIDLVEHIAL